MASVRGRRTQARLWVVFALGCTLGGAATGTGLGILEGLLSPVPTLPRWWVLAGLSALFVGLDLTRRPLPLPQRTVLIPQRVFAAGLARGALRFGLEYGCGWRTKIPSAAPYVAAVFVLLAVVPPLWAVALGTAFGLARSLAVLQYLTLGRPGWQAFLSRHSRVLERAGSVVTAGLLLAAAWGVG